MRKGDKKHKKWCFAGGILMVLVLQMSILAASGFAKNEDLLSVNFISPTSGWACGRWGKVCVTQDGGNTWAVQKTGVDYTLASIHFASPSLGVAVGDHGTIIRTENGGETWETISSPVSNFLMDVFFTSPDTGFIVTERTTILHTLNGGKSWSIIFQDEDYILKAVSFSDAENGWAVGEYGYIYKTSDGGKTWKHQAGFFDISDETGDIEGEAYLFDVHAWDASTAWAVGIDGTITHTRDGGKSWQVVKTGFPKVPLFAVTMGRDKSIVAAGEGMIIFSDNQGESWKKADMHPPLPYGWIYEVATTTGSGENPRFVACGKRGVIYQGSLPVFTRVDPASPASISTSNTN